MRINEVELAVRYAFESERKRRPKWGRDSFYMSMYVSTRQHGDWEYGEVER